MSLLRLCVLVCMMAQPAFAATITLDRGPTGDREVTFIGPGVSYSLRHGDGGRRQESTEYLRYRNEQFDTRGLTTDGASDASNEVMIYRDGTFLYGRVYRLEGQISAGDTDKLARVVEPHLRSLCPSGQNCPYSAVLSLNSPGGSLAEAIRLARFIRKWSLVTVVDKGDRCESACALAFFSAYGDFAGYSAPRRFAHIEAKVGIHQPSVEFDPSDPRVKDAKPADLFRLANVAISEVTSLFLQTGMSIGALDLMYATPPEEMLFLSPFQKLEESIVVFDDSPTAFKGRRSDLIAMCATRFSARHYTQSNEIVSNFMMQDDIFMTFDPGRNFLCSGYRNRNDEWSVRFCDSYQTCGYAEHVERMALENEATGMIDDDLSYLASDFWNVEFLGLRRNAHRSVLLRVLRDQKPEGDFDALMFPASALPMPPELCGRLDEAHPALVRLVQERLTALGHATGGVDGSLGQNTRKAILAANTRLGGTDRPDDRISPRLLAALKIPAATVDRYTLCHPAYRD